MASSRCCNADRQETMPCPAKHRHRCVVEMERTQASCSAFGHSENEIQSIIFRGNSTPIAASVQVTLSRLALPRKSMPHGLLTESVRTWREAVTFNVVSPASHVTTNVTSCRCVSLATRAMHPLVLPISFHRAIESEWHAVCRIIYLHIFYK